MDPEAVSVERQARRLRELFRNRFSQLDAERLVKEFDGETPALDFLLNENEEVVRGYLRKSEDYLKDLRQDSQGLASLLENGIPSSVRMFGCGACVRTWWKKVPQRKEVSKFHRCNVKFDPIPKDKEWGWGKFVCTCGNEFHGRAEMGVTESVCYTCHQSVPVFEILPPRRKKNRQRKSRAPHSCNAPNCYNRDCGNHDAGTAQSNSVYQQHSYGAQASDVVNQSNGYVNNQGLSNLSQDMSELSLDYSAPPGAYPTGSDMEPTCLHPKSQRPKQASLRYESRRHRSTGSTVSGVMSQGSIDDATVKEGSFLDDIIEEDFN